MNNQQIEYWALQVIDQINSGQPNEDARVELKAKWPSNLYRTARQLAGHANAARGEQILWLIGVHQEKGVVGAQHKELASWMPSLKSIFDGPSPYVTDLNMTVEGKTIVVLLFDTGSSPYVIKNPNANKKGCGPIKLEVPWREHTTTRSATRNDLLRILVPTTRLPTIDLISGSVEITRRTKEVFWDLNLELYISPSDNNLVVIPFYRISLRLKSRAYDDPIDLKEIRLNPPSKLVPGPIRHGFGQREPASHTLASSPKELVVYGPGACYLKGSAEMPKFRRKIEHTELGFEIEIKPASSDRSVYKTIQMLWSPKENRPERWWYQS